MRIESGTAKRTLMRLGFMVVLLLGFGSWFGYDGWHTYPQRNLSEAIANFPKAPEGSVTQNSAVTADSVKTVQERIKSDPLEQISLGYLVRQWGEPGYRGAADAVGGTGTGAEVAFFVGPYGWAKATLAGDQISDLEWRDASKNHSAILVQKLLAMGLALGAMVPLGMLLGQSAKKYVVDDEGLVMPGIGRIAYAQMTGVDAADLESRGILRLRYRNARGEEQMATLDEEKIELFDDIVVNLCKQKGWKIETEPAVTTEDGGPKES